MRILLVDEQMKPHSDHLKKSPCSNFIVVTHFLQLYFLTTAELINLL